MKEIRIEDLKPHTKLKYLELGRNELQVIEKDLFQFNPKLEAIYLANNRISHIDSNVFDNFVDQLSSLRLNGNICGFEDAFNNKAMANEIIRKVQSGFCNNGAAQSATTTTTTLTPFVIDSHFEEDLKLKLEEITGKFLEQAKEVKNFKEEMKNEFESLRRNFEEEKRVFEEFQEKMTKDLKVAKEEFRSEVRTLNKVILEMKIGASNATTAAVECLEARLKAVEKNSGIEPEQQNCA